MACQHCDGVPGSVETYKHQACMPIKGRVQSIDFCISHIVAALNAGGVDTVASCCGHEKFKGSITLEDGRTLVIMKTPKSMDEWNKVLKEE